MQQHDVGREPPRQRQHAIVVGAAARRGRDIDTDRGDTGTRRQLGDAEPAALLRLSQARHQRARSRIAPDQQ
jgi:hypothetical protein